MFSGWNSVSPNIFSMFLVYPQCSSHTKLNHNYCRARKTKQTRYNMNIWLVLANNFWWLNLLIDFWWDKTKLNKTSETGSWHKVLKEFFFILKFVLTASIVFGLSVDKKKFEFVKTYNA